MGSGSPRKTMERGGKPGEQIRYAGQIAPRSNIRRSDKWQQLFEHEELPSSRTAKISGGLWVSYVNSNDAGHAANCEGRLVRLHDLAFDPKSDPD